jgi:hypothetical protein
MNSPSSTITQTAMLRTVQASPLPASSLQLETPLNHPTSSDMKTAPSFVTTQPASVVTTASQPPPAGETTASTRVTNAQPTSPAASPVERPQPTVTKKRPHKATTSTEADEGDSSKVRSTAAAEKLSDWDKHREVGRSLQRRFRDNLERFSARMTRSGEKVERLAAEAGEAERIAAVKRDVWASELRNFHQLKGIAGFIEAQLTGIDQDLGEGGAGDGKHRRREGGEGGDGPWREPCPDFNQGWCNKGKSCRLRHVCCVCEEPHMFVKCASRRQICYKWNIGRVDECNLNLVGACRREHRCLLCAADHALCDYHRPEGDLPDMCLVWNSCGSGKACSEGTCGRIHRCLRCEGEHPVLRCKENVCEYIDQLFQKKTGKSSAGRRRSSPERRSKQIEVDAGRPRKRMRWD